jgi:glutathione S-transferase
MKLYWAPQTRSSRIVWMLEEAGVDYAIETVDIRAEPRQDSKAFLAASPMGKVPALSDGDVAMSESAAICLYLADRYCAGELAPAVDDNERGRFLYWMFFTPAVIEPSMAEKFNGIEPSPARNAWGSFELMLQTLQRALEGKAWLLGDRFSAADVMVGSSVVFMRMFKMLPEAPALNAYADRCLERPAYRKALSLEPA